MNLRQLNRILLRILLLPVLGMLLLSGILVWQVLSAVHTVDNIRVADRNISLAYSALGLAVDQETGLRGYQITGNEIFLQPYLFSSGPLSSTLAELRAGIEQQHGDPSAVDALIAADRSWQATAAQPLIDATRAGQNTSDAGANLRGKARMDSIRSQFHAMIDNQRSIRDGLSQQFHAAVGHTIVLTIGLALVIGLMLGTFSRGQLHAVTAAFQQTLVALRRHSEEVRLSEQRLRTILASIGDAVLVCDAKGRVEMLNPVAEHLTGWTQSEALHQPAEEVLRIVEENTRKPLESPTVSIQRTGRKVSIGQVLLLRRDGAEIPIDDSGAPVFDAAGRLSGAVMVFRDVTGQRRTQATLVASEKLAAAGRLASTIAHEIHNPLDAAINLIYLLRHNQPSAEETSQWLDMAAAELDRVTKISRAMLGMYRESRRPVVVDLSALLESLLLLLERQYAQADVRILPRLASGVSVTGFPAELRQAFTNLLTNALDASPPGGTVSVSLHKNPPESPGATVTVSDSGAGITDDVRSRLFQPFFTTKGENGTGLGLWVTRGIVERHGGTIRLENAPGGGATFTVALPLEKPSAELATDVDAG